LRIQEETKEGLEVQEETEGSEIEVEGILQNVNKNGNIFSFQEQIHNFEGKQCATHSNASQADLCTIIKLMNPLDPSTLQFRSDSCCVFH
jgi:hypothetical protein